MKLTDHNTGITTLFFRDKRMYYFETPDRGSRDWPYGYSLARPTVATPHTITSPENRQRSRGQKKVFIMRSIKLVKNLSKTFMKLMRGGYGWARQNVNYRPHPSITRWSNLTNKIKFDCLIYKILFIQKIKANLNFQSCSVRAKCFVWHFLSFAFVFLLFCCAIQPSLKCIQKCIITPI